jgi:hypothetical protein
MNKKLLPQELDQHYDVSKARMLFGSISLDHSLDYIRSVNGTTEDLIMELNDLKAGHYILYIEVEWIKPELITSFVLTSFSDQPLSLEAADKNEYHQNGRYVILDLLMKSCAQSNLEKRTFYEK